MNIGIAGAGLMGRLLAWQCLRAGHQVMLFDGDTIDGECSAARVAAAMLAPLSESIHCEPAIVDWGMRSLRLWPDLLQQLQADTGCRVYFQQHGSLVVAHPQDQSHLLYFNRQLRCRAADYLEHVAFIDRQKLSDVEPSLAVRFAQATFLKAEGCLDNWGLLDALAVAIERLGGQWYPQTVVDHVQPYQLMVDGKSRCFDWVIDARGMGAKSQMPGLRGVRGELLWVHAPEISLSRPIRLMHPRYQLYIAPKPEQRYVIGATEIESESMAPITVRSSLELQSALYSVDPRFAEATIIKAYAHGRPAFSDHQPRMEARPGLLRVNGLYRHGYLLAPHVLCQALVDIGIK